MLPVSTIDSEEDSKQFSGKQSLTSSNTQIMSSVLSFESNNDTLEDMDVPIIVGRNDEFSALKNAYDRVKNNHSFESAVVHGESGTGKTSLVMQLQESVLLDNGFFCFGKYFQNSEIRQDPYSAIMAAFSDLCDVMLQSDNFNEERRSMIEKELGLDGMLLVNAVTNISPFLGDKVDFGNSRNIIHRSFSFARFRVACKRFIRAMSSDDSPIVLFIDDIQWMDCGSKELLKDFLEDTQMKNVMLILTYREEDASSVKDLFSNQIMASVDVQLDKLDLNSVHEMIADRLGAATVTDIPIDQKELCKLISHKANGNPLYIINILETMKEDGLLSYDDETSSWICDLDTIQKNTMIPDSLAELISKKVERLDRCMKEILKMASLLGYRFTHQLIYELADATLNEEDGKSLPLILKNAIKLKIIEETCDGYQFTHDKLQAAFYAMLDVTEKEQLHLKVGKQLLTKQGMGFKYSAATHLNQCAVSNFGKTTKDRILLAKTNLEASKYCDARNAFVNATDFLRIGLEVLGDGEEKWLIDFDLAFEMTEFLAKMEFTIGNMDACTVANHDILQRSTSKNSRMNALSLEIDIQIAINDISTIGKAGKNALRELGIAMPPKLTPFHVLRKLIRVRKLLDSIDNESIFNLRPVDTDLPDVCKLVHFLGFYYAAQRDKPLWVIYTALLGTEYTLRNGLSRYSAILLNLYGVTEIFVLQNRTRGYRLGRIALELSSLFPRQHASRLAPVVHIIFNERSLQKEVLLNFTPENLNDGLEDGDFAFMLMFANVSFFARFWTGEHINSLEISLRGVCERLIELGQTGLLIHFQPLLQLILNLQNEEEENWEELIFLTGDIMNEVEFRNKLLELSTPHPNVFLALLISKMILAYHLEYNKIAELLCREQEKKRVALVNFSYLYLPLNFYQAMIWCARYRETVHRKYLRRIRKCRKVLNYHHSLGNPNATPFLRVIEAEELSLTPHDSEEICKAFDCAIEASAKEGVSYLEAHANERASCVLLETKSLETSKRYLELAKHAYKEKWGSPMKYKWLCQVYD